jgi:Fe2+ transport system protein B
MKYISEEQRAQIQSLQQQRLPSRDIPNDQSTYNHDEQVTPNYIPKAKPSSDYVREYEDMTEKNLREYEDKNRKEKKLDIILTELQVPIFIAVLFFFFQLPMINTLIFKRFAFLSIYNSDGNFNFTGLVFKSILFGSFYYITLKFTNFLSEF